MCACRKAGSASWWRRCRIRASARPRPIAGSSPAGPSAPAASPARWLRPGTLSVATMLGRPRENFCWGGGTAIRRSTFDDARVLEAWEGAVSDDFALTHALEAAGKPIVFCAECMAATLHPWTGASLLEFTNRQILITRVYAPKRWGMGMAAHLGYVAHAAFCRAGHPGADGGRRSLDEPGADRFRHALSRCDEGRAAHHRRDGNAAGMEGPARAMELGLDGAGAGRAVSVRLEFHLIARSPAAFAGAISATSLVSPSVTRVLQR